MVAEHEGHLSAEITSARATRPPNIEARNIKPRDALAWRHGGTGVPTGRRNRVCLIPIFRQRLAS
jgi:hypothetical protein